VSLFQRAGLPQIRFHDLRDTCATLLLSRNVHPKYVQELLGHATVAITLDTYSHVIPGLGNHTARAMEDVFSLGPPQLSSNCRQEGLGQDLALLDLATFDLEIATF
jgi:hypothetical protein